MRAASAERFRKVHALVTAWRGVLEKWASAVASPQPRSRKAKRRPEDLARKRPFQLLADFAMEHVIAGDHL